MSQLSVKEHLDGILSDFEALKRSFDMEDVEDVPAFSPSSPPRSPFSPSLPAVTLATGNREGRRAGGPIQASYPSHVSLSSDPSPAQSPVLKTRISSSLSFNRGTVHLARANGSNLTRVSSFQTRLNPNGYSSSLGLGSDNESLHSSSSSLECPTPIKSLQNVTQPAEAPGSGASHFPSPVLKKFFSHSNVFHAEADRPVQPVSKVTANRGSLPSLDLHIVEDQGANPALGPPPSPDPAAPQSSSNPTYVEPLPQNSPFATKESPIPPLEIGQLAHMTPPAPAARQTVKLQKFPISLDGLIEKVPASGVVATVPDGAPKPSPRAQVHVSLRMSPSLSRQPTELAKDDRGVLVGAGSPLSSLPGTTSPLQSTPFRRGPEPQTGQAYPQPPGSPPMRPAQGTPATGNPREHDSAPAKRIHSIPGQEAPQPQTPGPTARAKEDALVLANRPLEASSKKKEPQGKGLLKEESRPEPLWIGMEDQPARAQLPPDAPSPGTGDPELFGYVGIEAVLDQMRIKTMKTGFEFNIMVVGQSGLGKSTMVNTLFKSKVSRKSSCPGYEERIPKTVQLLSATHVVEEKGVKMKLTVTDTPGFGDQINNQNCWEPIVEYINDQYERYLREEILINRKRKIPDMRVHACVYFVPPTGHWLRPLDLEFMRRLNKITNVVPVIAKADTLTLEERAEFRQRIQKDLKAHGIQVYPQEEFDDDSDDRLLNDKIREKIPFAVVGADKEHQVNGKKVLGRKTKWGIIEVENPAHCEFPLLRDLLIRSHLQDLKDITHNVHYEQYRMNRLNESNVKAKRRPNSVERDPESHL